MHLNELDSTIGGCQVLISNLQLSCETLLIDYQKETLGVYSSVYSIYRFFPNLFSCESSSFITSRIHDASHGLSSPPVWFLLQIQNAKSAHGFPRAICLSWSRASKFYQHWQAGGNNFHFTYRNFHVPNFFLHFDNNFCVFVNNF